MKALLPQIASRQPAVVLVRCGQILLVSHTILPKLVCRKAHRQHHAKAIAKNWKQHYFLLPNMLQLL